MFTGVYFILPQRSLLNVWFYFSHSKKLFLELWVIVSNLSWDHIVLFWIYCTWYHRKALMEHLQIWHKHLPGVKWEIITVVVKSQMSISMTLGLSHSCEYKSQKHEYIYPNRDAGALSKIFLFFFASAVASLVKRCCMFSHILSNACKGTLLCKKSFLRPFI